MADDKDKDPDKDDPKKTDPKDDLGDAGKRALDAERKARRDAEQKLSDLQKRLGDLEDKDKSELQKLTDRLAVAEKTAADAEARALRMEVAVSKGLTAAQAKRLTGATKDELEADADELLETFRPPAKDGDSGDDKGDPKGNPTNRPVPKLSGGGDPTQAPETDLRKAISEIPRGI